MVSKLSIKPAPAGKPLEVCACGAAALFIALAGVPAQAATFDLNLSGVVANGAYSSFTGGGIHFDKWTEPLSGLGSVNAITVSQGDTIDATIVLDKVFTIPASEQYTIVDLAISGRPFPPGTTVVSGSTTFFDGASQVATGSGNTTTGSSSPAAPGNVTNAVSFFPPSNTAITFDSVTSDFTIITLVGPGTLDDPEISYELISSFVPEPATWALMLMGFGSVGAAMRGSWRGRAAASAWSIEHSPREGSAARGLMDQGDR